MCERVRSLVATDHGDAIDPSSRYRHEEYIPQIAQLLAILRPLLLKAAVPSGETERLRLASAALAIAVKLGKMRQCIVYEPAIREYLDVESWLDSMISDIPREAELT